MLRLAFITVALLATGCAAQHQAVVLHAPSPDGMSAPNPPANLALGPDRDVAWLSSAYSVRSNWPATDAGYFVEDWSTYVDVQVDNRFSHDRLGGYYRTGYTTRSATLVR